MARARRLGTTALLVAMVVVIGSPALAGPPEIHGEAEEDVVQLDARAGFEAEQRWLASATDPAVRLVEYMRARMCGISSLQPSTPENGNCTADEGPTHLLDCAGVTPLQPLWRRERVAPGAAWGVWTLAAPSSCPQEVLPAFTAEDFRRLPLTPAQVTVQPAASTVLVNIPTITMAAAPQQNLATDLLGYPVEVQATATSYTWDYGDGSAPLTTTSPGHAYPNHDVHHSYARPGTYTITLTTTWSGQYRIAGSTAWLDVDGTATTVTTIPPITAVEQRTALVAEPCTPSTC